MTVLPRDGRADGHVSFVVCVALATRDTILAVAPPSRHRRARPCDRCRDRGGGPAATAAVALARLGVTSYFVGSVGDDETGAFEVGCFEAGPWCLAASTPARVIRDS